MKICSRSYFLCLNRLFWILLHLLLTTMSMSIWCITFQDPLAMIKNVAYGRCIHDDLRFAIKEQSPQQYDESQPVFPATDVQSSNSQSKSESPTLKNHKFQQSQFVSSAVNLQQSNNNQPSSSKALEQPTLNSTLSHLLPDQSFTSSTLHNISRIRRNNDYSNFSIANKDSIEDFQSFDLNHTSINAAKENLTPTFLFINQTYKPLRLTVWYDFHHMAFANTSIEFERLKQGFDLANEELVKLLSGKFFSLYLHFHNCFIHVILLSFLLIICSTNNFFNGKLCYDDFKSGMCKLSDFFLLGPSGVYHKTFKTFLFVSD